MGFQNFFKELADEDEHMSPPKVHRTHEQTLIYRTMGLELKTFRLVDGLEIKGVRGISGKVRYLVELGLESIANKKRRRR